MMRALKNRKTRAWIYQAVVLVAAVGLTASFVAIARNNLLEQGIATGFDFLWETAGFDIGEGFIKFDASEDYGRAFVVGILNTLHVAFVGIVFATLLGFVMGIARVSRNWLASRIAHLYVEVVRNVPVVLHVIFWAAVIRVLPPPRQALEPMDGVFITNRGLIFAVPVEHPVYTWVAIAFLIGLAAAFALGRWARRRREATGQLIPTFWPGLGLIVGLPLLAWLVGGAPLQWDVPALKGFNFRGGMASSPEFVALLIGITVYTGAFIAEIVRSGIQSVGSGQIEAARSLGLKPGFIMRYITIPQALRVIVPPTTSQYLSLTKNSSLGVLIGYPDLVNVGNTTLNQTGQAVEAIAVMMLVYLTISLTISVFMNAYNRLVAIKER